MLNLFFCVVYFGCGYIKSILCITTLMRSLTFLEVFSQCNFTLCSSMKIIRSKVMQYGQGFHLWEIASFIFSYLTVFPKLIIAIHTLIVFDGWLSILVSQPIKHLLYVIKKASAFRYLPIYSANAYAIF